VYCRFRQRSKRDKGRLRQSLSSIRFVEQFQNGLVDYTKYEQLYPAQVTCDIESASTISRSKSRPKRHRTLVDTVRNLRLSVGMQNRTANTTHQNTNGRLNVKRHGVSKARKPWHAAFDSANSHNMTQAAPTQPMAVALTLLKMALKVDCVVASEPKTAPCQNENDARSKHPCTRTKAIKERTRYSVFIFTAFVIPPNSASQLHKSPKLLCTYLPNGRTASSNQSRCTTK
jgi:hypothetical protein